MLDLDCAVPQLARLALRTTDRLARLFCERLKHTQKLVSIFPTVSRMASFSGSHPVEVMANWCGSGRFVRGTATVRALG